MTLNYMPAAHPLLLTALISLAVVSAFQQSPSIARCSSRRSSPHLQLEFHHRRGEHNTCSYSSALQQSLYGDDNDDGYYYDEFDDWDNSDGWYNDDDGLQQQQQYNNDSNMNTQFPPPPYDRPPYSSNLRNNIASSSSSPYDNPSWTKSSRYGNRNVNFNSRSNRVNTFDYLPQSSTAAAGNINDRYTPRYGYGRETYRNSRPPPPPPSVDNAMNDVMPNDEYYNSNNSNESPLSPFSLNQLSRKLYRDYDYDDDPNSSSRNGSGPSSRFQGRMNNNNSNSPYYQRSSESSRYRNYDDDNYVYTRSYRNDVNEQDGARSGSNNFPPRPESQYRDYDDINYAPSRSYRREDGSMNVNSRTVDDDNNRNKYTKFPPPPPPPPRRRRSQSIPNNFAPPQSNRSDSPRINFPPGVGPNMGYTPPSEYIPQNNNGNNGRVGVGGGGRSSRTPPPPRPPPQRPPRPPQSRYNNNNNNRQKYQYDINRQEKYIDDDELRRSQTQYNFPNGETIRNERINTLRPIGFNSIFSDMFTPFRQMFRSASQSLQSSDMLKEARLRIVEDEVIRSKLGEPLEVSPPFSQSSSMSSVTTTYNGNNNGQTSNNKASTKVRARFQVGGPYGTGVATMDSVDGMIRSLVVDVNGVTVRIGPRQKKNGSGRNGNRRKNVVEAEILDD
jgi:hypothetical protein